ncbi:MAG: UDP-2,4-diacetamido-2,4,6-trideoxy-beta-L-altropyranose hydrolase [Rhodospirillales bacterium]|nr:UDP-2,4-diacetamido-2,4,6-trideoxy-beta-L-altropyranose hydrolase [Rhodospirillales bacterium]
MRALFRADSSLDMGSGHMRRCLALANCLAKKGVSCTFLARDVAGNVNALVRAAGHQLIASPNAEFSVEADAEAVMRALSGSPPFDFLIVDHYGLDHRWQRTLRPKARCIVAIDDLANRRHDCDVLIDVTPGEERAARYDALIPRDALTLFGPRFALLRPEFPALRATLRTRTGRIQRILIGYGAIDAGNHSEITWRAIRQTLGAEVAVDITLGTDAPHKAALAQAIQHDPHAHLHVDASDMAALMAAADLSIGAGGTTSWERACLGLPAIIMAIADNQRDNVEALVLAGAAVHVRDGLGYDAGPSQELKALASAPEHLIAMGEAAARLVDGKGAERIAAVLLRTKVTLRPAQASDCRDLWQWRNEPKVREASTASAPIPWEDHRTWFEATLGNPDRRLLIGESDGVAIGVLRFDLAGETATVSAHLTPAGHGRGLGSELLMRGQAWLQRNCPHIVRIEALILPGNIPSIAAFTAARYRPRGEYYVRELSHDASQTH